MHHDTAQTAAHTPATESAASRPPHNPGHLADDLVVHFETGRKSLTTEEAEALGRWVGSWAPHEADALVVMACSAPSLRSVRVDRLRKLRGLLAQHGVSEHSVRYTGDLVDTPTTGSGRPAASSATLKVVSARRAERQVRSIRSFFASDRSKQEVACTNAS